MTLKIEINPHTRRSTLTISINEEPWQNIHTAIFGFRPSLPKNCTSIEQFSKDFSALEYKQAKLYTIKRLSLMNLPSAKLIKCLKERLVSEENISRVINELSELGYINDKEWTSSFVRTQSQRKLGPRAIAQKLAAKGMSSTYAKELLEETQSEENQKIAIKQLLATKYRTRNLKDFAEKKKVIASLIRRGYEFSLIFDVLGDSDCFNY